MDAPLLRDQKGVVRREAEQVNPEEFVSGVRIVCIFCLRVSFFVFLGLIGVVVLAGVMEKEISHLPLIIGLVLVLAATGLAFAFANHSPLQQQVIAVLFSLGGSAVATDAITGALNIQLSLGPKTLITASGAFAVFTVIYFFRARWDR